MNTSTQTIPAPETSHEVELRPEALQAIQSIGQALGGPDPEADVEITATTVSFPDVARSVRRRAIDHMK